MVEECICGIPPDTRKMAVGATGGGASGGAGVVANGSDARRCTRSNTRGDVGREGWEGSTECGVSGGTGSVAKRGDARRCTRGGARGDGWEGSTERGVSGDSCGGTNPHDVDYSRVAYPAPQLI